MTPDRLSQKPKTEQFKEKLGKMGVCTAQRVIRRLDNKDFDGLKPKLRSGEKITGIRVTEHEELDPKLEVFIRGKQTDTGLLPKLKKALGKNQAPYWRVVCYLPFAGTTRSRETDLFQLSTSCEGEPASLDNPRLPRTQEEGYQEITVRNYPEIVNRIRQEIITAEKLSKTFQTID